MLIRVKSLNRWIKTRAELFEAGKGPLQPECPLYRRLIGLCASKFEEPLMKEDEISRYGVPLGITVPVQHILVRD